jgi:hypothetical protein
MSGDDWDRIDNDPGPEGFIGVMLIVLALLLFMALFVPLPGPG